MKFYLAILLSLAAAMVFGSAFPDQQTDAGNFTRNRIVIPVPPRGKRPCFIPLTSSFGINAGYRDSRMARQYLAFDRDSRRSLLCCTYACAASKLERRRIEFLGSEGKKQGASGREHPASGSGQPGMQSGE